LSLRVPLKAEKLLCQWKDHYLIKEDWTLWSWLMSFVDAFTGEALLTDISMLKAEA
jgi:hypothetical protein